MDIIENFEQVFRVADKLKNLELYAKLSELRTRVIEVEEENRTLREQLKLARQPKSTVTTLPINTEGLLTGNQAGLP